MGLDLGRRCQKRGRGLPWAGRMAAAKGLAFLALSGLVCGLTLGLAPSEQGASDSPPQVSRPIEEVFDQVYQIKTATEATAPKAAYGSCFVVDPKGILATNFHVVAYSLHEPEKYHLYLVDGDRILPAEVITFDAINDLALVRVERTFPKAVHFATKLPNPGAKIFSIGWPEDLNKSVIEGNFNGLMTAGPYQKVQMSIPLNPGMSGGPTLNERGDLVGVNVSLRTDSQNLAFAVPAALVQALMKNPIDPEGSSFSNPEDHASFDEEVRAQLSHVQEQLASLILKGHTHSVILGGWQAQKPAHMVKCWHEQENTPGDRSVVVSETCYLPGTAPVRSDVDTGTFRVRYQTVSTSRLNTLQFIHQINDMIPSFGFKQADYVADFTTTFSCHEEDMINAHRVPLRVHYCVNGYVRYAETYNVEVEAVSLNQKDEAMLMGISLLGFSSRNSTEIVRTLLNSIRQEAP